MEAYDSFRYADRLKSNLFFIIDAVGELSKLQGTKLEEEVSLNLAEAMGMITLLGNKYTSILKGWK